MSSTIGPDEEAATGDASPGRSATATVLFLCTGNICRSRMAEAILVDRAARRRLPLRAASAGLLEGGLTPPPEVATVLEELRVPCDRLTRPGRTMRRRDLDTASLVLGLAREHVRAAAVLRPEVWPRAFTLKELVRRGRDLGPRSRDEPLEGWVARAHAGRQPEDLLGRSTDDDVEDPFGLPLSRYRRTGQEIAHAVDELVELLWPLRPEERCGAGGAA
ncbi:MAG TPA: hypothetical protein VKU92_03735 [Acidimicrobiales bacterium]|nr:hypothetical protein [Acidimicrobiales bacterium]